jgi:drug/metabolite transporter (DMT)-like permease
MTTLTMVGISAMLGVLIGYGINETMGGRRSSIGVHRRDGRLLSFWPGFLFFSLITIVAAFTTTAASAFLSETFSGLGGFILAFGGVAFFLTIVSYSR